MTGRIRSIAISMHVFTHPLCCRADLADSSLSICVPLERTNLVFLVGGPPTPLYPPNKVVLFDVKADRAVAELEFREEVRGLAARRDRLVVALRRRVIVFVLGHAQAGIWREGTYETTDNPKGERRVRLDIPKVARRGG